MPDRSRLRRPTLVAAPLLLVGIMAMTAAVAGALWGTWYSEQIGTGFVAGEVALVVAGTAAFVAARGCFVEIDPDRGELRDVVAWITRFRIPQAEITEARVRAGPWRWFELDLANGDTVVVAGMSPTQFPARLLPGAAERDLADLDALMGWDSA
ncbi:MAG: hypothetical protein V9E94_15705 [Microthrixaceae bacterium]